MIIRLNTAMNNRENNTSSNMSSRDNRSSIRSSKDNRSQSIKPTNVYITAPIADGTASVDVVDPMEHSMVAHPTRQFLDSDIEYGLSSAILHARAKGTKKVTQKVSYSEYIYY